MSPQPPAPKAGASGPTATPKDAAAGEGDRLSNIRHSLRTPLNQILGYSEILEEEAAESDLSSLLPDLQKIHIAGGQLLALVNDGLAPWKIEAGKVDLDLMRFEMRTPLNLILGYAELCQEEAGAAGHTRFVDDLKRIETATQNLLSLLESKEFPTQVEVTALAARQRANQSGQNQTGIVAERRAQPTAHGNILIVDDNPANLDLLARRLDREGYTVTTAENGQQAIDAMRARKFDIVLLDVLMPVMDGFQTLSHLKADEYLKNVPVIMLSALDEVDNAVRCIEVGAEDYIPKPFNSTLLRARIGASLEKKRLRDREQAYLEQLQMEREKSDQLLLNILPEKIAARLKQGESLIADYCPDASVLFADLVDFTKHCAALPPHEVVQILNEIFSGFDWLAELHGLEKIKTIGDSYMLVGGIPTSRGDHAATMADMALEMQKVVKRFKTSTNVTFSVRIGMSVGAVVAGIIGRKKFIYDLWGDTVNVASRMESHGVPGLIQVSGQVYERLRDRFNFEKRGIIEVKGKGEMTTYILTGRIGRPGI